MIKVIKEMPIPRAQITCPYCGSVLEYGNADLNETCGVYHTNYFCLKEYSITCPVCSCEIKDVKWIEKEEEK